MREYDFHYDKYVVSPQSLNGFADFFCKQSNICQNGLYINLKGGSTMSVFRDAKVEKVAEIKEKLQAASSFVLVDYKGLTVAEDTALRSEFRKSGVSYHVYKNRLLKIALNELGYSQFDEALNGPTAIALGSTDISAPAKIAMEKGKAFKKLPVKCGFVDGKYLDEKGVNVLATLPSREGLISQILGLLQSPVAGLARAIAAIAEKQA